MLFFHSLQAYETISSVKRVLQPVAVAYAIALATVGLAFVELRRHLEREVPAGKEGETFIVVGTKHIPLIRLGVPPEGAVRLHQPGS